MSGLTVVLCATLFAVMAWLFLPGVLDGFARSGRKSSLKVAQKPDALADALFDTWSGRL